MLEEEEMKSAQMKNYKYLLCLFAMRLCQSAPDSTGKTHFSDTAKELLISLPQLWISEKELKNSFE